MRPGYSLDLTTKDPKTGLPWDLSSPTVQARVKELIKKTEPYCVIGSPPCTPFSPLQGLNNHRRDPKVVEREIQMGKKHMRFCLEIYAMQLAAHRHFVHEHPERSRAWLMPEMQQFLLRPEVGSVVMHMCAFGMTAKDEHGRAPVLKPTRIMSSSEEILKRIDRRCSNGYAGHGHRHVQLISGRARFAQVYPRKFAIALCQGIAAQRKLDNLGMKARALMSVDEMKKVASTSENEDPSEALHEPGCEGMEAYDDITGQELDPRLMMRARRDEIKYFRDMGVYEKVSVQESYEATGKAPIAVRWVDINKGDSASPNYRSRLVAKEFNTGPCPELYAATPPSECLRLMISKVASSIRRDGIGLMSADVSRAYLYAKAVRPVYVKLPEEDTEKGDEGKCGKLMMSMYGTRDAPLNWAIDYGILCGRLATYRERQTPASSTTPSWT